MKKIMLVIMVLLISIAFSKDIYISFVLDETGSMYERRAETISSFNEYLEMLQNKDEKVFMTLTKFNSDRTVVVFNKVNVNYLSGLSDKTYYPQNMTPLYDAIGKTVNEIGDVDNMLFVILTDGLENRSVEYDQSSIFNLVKEKKEIGWTFVFMGADQDSYVAENFGIDIGNIYNWDSNGSIGIGTVSPMQQLILNTSSYIQDDAVQTTGFFNETNEEGEEK